MRDMRGFANGIISSVSFGLIPLFTIPVINAGMGMNSILVYRFSLACLMLGLILAAMKQSFSIKRSDLPALIGLAVLYDASALFLLWGYQYMGSGIATTLHFMYPVITTVIMMLFFGEKRSLPRLIAIILAIGGVVLLSFNMSTGHVNISGVAIVLISALAYALYLVFVNRSHVSSMKGPKLTFYVFLFGSLMFIMNAQVKGGVQPVPDLHSGFNLLLLALVPTIVSNLALVQAVKRIGSTLTSVLGAMEPVTAVAVGITVFGEPFTHTVLIGVVMIIASVSIIILKR